MSNTQLLEKLDAAIAEKNLLKHPFYQDWQAGELSRGGLQLYAGQYYRHVGGVPQHPRVVAARAGGSVAGVVWGKLGGEEKPAGDHTKAWWEVRGWRCIARHRT